MIKDFINIDENDEFIKLRGLDLQELIVQTENYYLEYRYFLNLPEYLTFGVEIEYENIKRKKIKKLLRKRFPTWISKKDDTINYGGEIISPIMKDEEKYWEELQKICRYLTKKKADTRHNAGGHVHIGVNILGNDIKAWKSFLKLYIAYESVLFRFNYGDKIGPREKIDRYAAPVAEELYQLLEKINNAKEVQELKKILPNNYKFLALNFKNIDFDNPSETREGNTFEFRAGNGTSNATVWQNYINVSSKMLLSASKRVINDDFLDYKLKNDFIAYSENKYLYFIVNIKNAMEFVDLVFDNNLDKIYFLRQYLKNFQDGYRHEITSEAKRFVKK